MSRNDVGRVESFFKILASDGLSEDAKAAFDLMPDGEKERIFRRAENA